MERASLRPVPVRPPRGIEAADALAHVTATLPDLEPPARDALALVELAGRSRAATAAELDLGRLELGELLAMARKALRRASFPLNASGWCERAELLISDRIDGELGSPRRLDVHLRNCGRCVEHERRLESARDALVRGFVAKHPELAERLEREVGSETPAEATVASVESVPLTETQPDETEPAPIAPEEPTQPSPAEPEQPEEAPLEPVAATSEEDEEMNQDNRQFATQSMWGFMYSLAIVLTIAAVALTVAGASGAV